MKYLLSLSLLLLLAGCGGSPMSVERRWVDDRPDPQAQLERKKLEKLRTERRQGGNM